MEMSLSRISTSGHRLRLLYSPLLTVYPSSFVIIPILSYSSTRNQMPGLRVSPYSTAAARLQSSLSLSPSGGQANNFEIPMKGSKVLLKGMRYTELEKWVQSQGYRPSQALM